jgi:hypothetical protein
MADDRLTSCSMDVNPAGTRIFFIYSYSKIWQCGEVDAKRFREWGPPVMS